MTATEHILCAAIHVDDGQTHKGAWGDGYPKTGRVFGGYRHCEIFPLVKGQPGKHTHGFITSRGRFVDRREAAIIAFQAGQVVSERHRLHSEDLY